MPLIAFSSPKGGVGKTTIASHVAALLSGRGYGVIAIDLDPQNALRLHLGLPMSTESGFMQRIDQRPDWRHTLVKSPTGVGVLPYGVVDPRRTLELSAQLFAEPELLTAPLRDMIAQPGMVVVLDLPPGHSAALEAALPLVDLVCLVLLADAGSAALMPQVVSGQVFGRGTLAGRFVERMGVVMNQADFASPLSAAVMDCAIRALGPRLLGAICLDMALSEALAEKRMLTDGEPGAGEDLVVVTDRIVSLLRLPPPAPPAPAGMAFPALSEWGLR
jgi:cellulose synthase operon protein YhjQ